MKQTFLTLILAFFVAFGLNAQNLSFADKVVKDASMLDVKKMTVGQVNNPKSLSGSFVEFYPSGGGDAGYLPNTTQDFVFNAVSYTSDYAYVYNVWLKFPADWTVNSVSIVGTPTCTNGTWGTLSYTVSPTNVVNINHPRYQSTTDNCQAYYMVNVTTGASAGDAYVSWYWDGDDYGGTPHWPCSSDGYTPDGQSPCDEAVNPQAVIPLSNPGALWEQLVIGSNYYTSQDFESGFDTYDNQAADDFVVTGGPWNITSISCYGAIWNGSGPLQYLNIYFYPDNAGVPETTATAQFLSVSCVMDAGTGLVTADLPSTVTLANGTYWISIVARMDFGTAGQWGWYGSTSTNGYNWMWKNPGNGFGYGAINWTDGATVLSGTETDLTFGLYTSPVEASDVAITAYGPEYTILPISQVDNNLSFEGNIINEGATNVTNAVMSVTINDGSNDIWTGNSDAIDLATGLNQVVMTNTSWATILGDFEISSVVTIDETDEDLSDNEDIYYVALSDSVLARDNGLADDGTLSIGDGIGGALGTLFDVAVTDELTSVSFYIGSESFNPTGTETMDVIIYDFDGSTPVNLLYQSPTYSVTTTTPGWHLVVLDTPLSLAAGTYFVGLLEHTTSVMLARCIENYTPNTSWLYFTGVPWTTTDAFASQFNGNYLLRPNFGGSVVADEYQVNFSVTGGNGALLASVNSAYITSGDMVTAGEDVTFTASPNANYQVAQWTVNSVVQAETGNTFIYTGLDNDITVTVSFEEQIVGYNVYFGANTAGGSVTAADGTGPITSGTFVEEGQDVVFTAVADFGYQFSEWYLDDVLQAETSNIFTYSNLDQTIDVRASFEVAPQEWVVNFNVVSGNGTLIAEVNSTEITSGDYVSDGVNVEFTATPDPSYKVKEWTVDGTPVDGNTSLFYTLSDLNDDVTVTVEFEAEAAGETDIIAYSFTEQTGNAIINSTDHTVEIEVVYGTDLTDLVATFTLSTGATALIGVDAQESGVTSNDFSSSVTYTVNNDVNTQDWVVTVTEQKALVIFTVTDLSHEYTGFYLKGTFDENGEYDATWNFNADQGMFYDNGLAGDAVAGDYVWTYAVELVPSNNPWEWGFTDLTNNVVATNISFSVPDVNTQTQNYTIAAIGINEVRKEIVAYPNPSNGLFTITADAQYTARIFDVTGKLILVTEIDETNNQIDLSTQNKGMYFIQLIGEKDQVLRVIVK